MESKKVSRQQSAKDWRGLMDEWSEASANHETIKSRLNDPEISARERPELEIAFQNAKAKLAALKHQIRQLISATSASRMPNADSLTFSLIEDEVDQES